MDALGSAAPARPLVLRFGSFELDLHAGELRESGALVHLKGQPLELLGLLARHAGEVVSRERIQAEIWGPGVHVDFDQGINACIRQIRAALGDSADSPRFIRTLPRRGYRFLAPVEERRVGPPRAPGEVEPAVSTRPPVRSDARQPSRSRRQGLWLAATSLVLATTVIGATLLLGHGREPAPLLLVLPFQDLTQDRTGEALADGLTEELIAELTRRYGASLGVIAPTSSRAYKGRALDAAAFQAELGATHALEGSVRRERERVRVTVRLVRTSDLAHAWAVSYDRRPDDLIALQGEVADAIVRALGLKLLPAGAREGNRTADPLAYADYLEGRARLSARPIDASGARGALERAVERDPGFAAARAALGRAWLASGAPGRALEALREALALDDSLAEAHLVLGTMHLFGSWNLDTAGRELERALELEPGNSEAHHRVAGWHSAQGRHEEALASVRTAARLDPRSTAVLTDVGWYAYCARRFDEAVQGCRLTLALSPRDYWARRCLLLIAHLRGDDEAIVDIARGVAAEPGEGAAALRAALDAAGPGREAEAFWRWDLEEKQARVARGEPLQAEEAATWLVLGEPERALDALEQAVDARRGWSIPFLEVDPLYDPLREDPRFRALLARVRAR